MVKPHIRARASDPHIVAHIVPLSPPGLGSGSCPSFPPWGGPSLLALLETVVTWLHCALLFYPAPKMQSLRSGPRQIPAQLHCIPGLLGNTSDVPLIPHLPQCPPAQLYPGYPYLKEPTSILTPTFRSKPWSSWNPRTSTISSRLKI